MGSPTVIGTFKSGSRPPSVTLEAAGVILTMGCSDSCPVYPGKHRDLDWELPDPAGKDLDEVRAIRDDIARRVDGLVTELMG